MRGRVIVASAGIAAVLAATPAVAREFRPAKLTVSGVGIVRVNPKDSDNNASIVRAVKAAEKKAAKRAFRDAFTRARKDAKAAGLVLGGVISISDRGFAGPGSPFGPNKFCGKVRVLAHRPVPGKPPQFKKVRRCYVPRFVGREITVKFRAQPSA